MLIKKTIIELVICRNFIGGGVHILEKKYYLLHRYEVWVVFCYQREQDLK